MAKKNAAEGTAPPKPAAAPKPEKAPKAPKEPKAEKAPKVALESQNGVSRPRKGSKTGRVWEIADEIAKKTRKPAERSAVMEAGRAEQIPDATIATQYGRWRKFNGLEGRLPKAA